VPCAFCAPDVLGPLEKAVARSCHHGRMYAVCLGGRSTHRCSIWPCIVGCLREVQVEEIIRVCLKPPPESISGPVIATQGKPLSSQ